MSEVFDSRFRKLLMQILRRAPQLRGARQSELRSHRQRRSESGTFSGHRAYTVGEDLRNLDWNVYARTGELFLKVLEDEDRRGLTLILDRSRSMAADGRWPGALRLAAILGGLALVRLDGLQLVLGPGQHASLEGAAALRRYLGLLANLDFADVPPLALARLLLDQRLHGHVVWISDFAEPENWRPALRMLRKQGCRLTGWLASVREDLVACGEGRVLFEDPETSEQEVMQVDARLRQAMGQELERLARQQQVVFDRAGYALLRFPLPPESDGRLGSWLQAGGIYRV